MNKTIKLTEIRKEDSEDLFKWINDPDLVVFNSVFRPVHFTNHDDWMKKLTSDKSRVVFAIRDEQEFLLGTCQLHSINTLSGTAELQIRIGNTEHYSKGIGTAAIEQLVSYGFKHLNLRKIYLYVFSDNLRAIKCYEKCKFVLEGELKKHAFVNGEFKNIKILSCFSA